MTRQHRRVATCAAALASCAALVVSPACGTGLDHVDGARRQFDIPAGPASHTVTRFARQAQLNVLASGEALQGIQTPAVRGAYTSAEALARLLAGTGLRSRANASGTVFVVPAPATVAASAQLLAPLPPPPPVVETVQEAGVVSVVGTKASQQSSISARKHAATTLDVIVADDVGSFPDRNIAEAISRSAGISLERGDFGEGRRVDLRGNGPERTRIEIDGMALLAAGGSDMNLGGGGRGVELRELTADQLASVSVVTGATPDMTEGSLGGTILIKTRSPLDFKGRHLSARVAATRSSLNRDWTPTLNAVFADKFAGGRVGVLLNLTRTVLHNEGHFNQNATSGIAGYARMADLDGAADKTFVFQPQTVNLADPAAHQPLFRAPTRDGGAIDFETASVLLAKAAGAQTQADCRSAFPAPGADALAAMRSESVRAAATRFRQDALQTCLNQWNDYTPSRLRNIVKRNDDRRSNADLRVDVKVTAALSVYAKLMNNKRRVIDELASLERGRPEPGAASNLVPGSVRVDSSHHLTEAVIQDAAYFVDNIHNPMSSNSRYAQAGATWRAPGLRIDLMAAHSRAGFARGDMRLSGIGHTYGQARLSAQADGSWRLESAPEAPGQEGYQPYAALLPAAAPGAAQLSRPALLTYAPRAGEMGERQVKLDVTWSPRWAGLPFLGAQKWGASRRHYSQRAWVGGANGMSVATDSGVTGGADITVPAAQVRIGISACQDGAAPDAARCPLYGYTPGSGAFTRRGSYVLRPEDFSALLAAVMPGRRTSTYFGGAAERPTGLLDSWAELDVPAALARLDIATFNHDCLKSCVGSDGRAYSQPSTGIADGVDALYWMSDFDLGEVPGLRLPAGMELSGNFGWRYVRSRVQGSGFVTYRSITKCAAWNPAQPHAPGGMRTVTQVRDTVLAHTSSTILPMFNLMFWPVRDRLLLRYSRARAMARHPDFHLVPAGVCTYDQVLADANATAGAVPGGDSQGAMSCSNEFGNPAMRPLINTNHNLALEWYPNRNTLLSLAAYRLRGTAGPGRRAQVHGAPLRGSGAVDPASGAPLGDIAFTHATVVNGTPGVRSGWEASAKLAFTALPGVLRHGGLDANYSRSRPKLVDGHYGHHRDLLTGEYQDAAFVPRSSWNLSLWYDDGRFSARAALQVVGSIYTSLGPGFAGGTDLRNYNAVGVDTIVAPPWNPGSANIDEATRYVDLKFSYKHSTRVELFGELRNAARRMVIHGQGPYNRFASGAPTVNEFAYTGSRATVGLNLRY